MIRALNVDHADLVLANFYCLELDSPNQALNLRDLNRLNGKTFGISELCWESSGWSGSRPLLLRMLLTSS
jgi:hypothetical protein